MEQMFTGQEFDLALGRLREVFADGREAEVPLVGIPPWSTDNEAVATATPSADGVTAVVRSVGPGSTVIRVKPRAATSSGEREAVLTCDVQVDEAGNLTADLTAGERRQVAA